MLSVPHAKRTLFGIREEYIIAMMMVPLLFGCLFTKPFIVEVENFNSGSPSELLAFAGGDNDSVSFNISKYVAMGNNWTSDGVFSNFTVQLCPTAGSPSNLTIHWPYTNGSSLMWAGDLTDCQNVSVDTSEFDPYFETGMAPAINFLALAGGGSVDFLNSTNTMMLREPHMYHVSDDVWYTIVVPESIPQDVISNLSGTNITLYQINSLGYSCYDGDSVRYVYQPAERINTSFEMPTLPIPLPLPNMTFLNASAAIYDMHCPAYLTEGKYRAEIKKVNITIENATFNFTQQIFSDDFDADPLNASAWLPLAVNGSSAAYYTNDYTNSKLWLYSYSPTNDSGIIVYLANPPLLNPNEIAQNATLLNMSNFTGLTVNEVGWDVSVRLDSSDMNATDYSLAILLMNFTLPPSANYSDLNSSFRGGFATNGTDGVAICPDGTVLGSGSMPPANYTFRFLSKNTSFDMYVDNTLIGSCAPVNETLFLALTSDPTVEMYDGGTDSFDFVSVSFFVGINGSGSFWMDVPAGYAYSDVIVCNCPDRWNRPFEFNISSDTAGTVNISIVNISYESLIGYSSPTPSVNIDSASMFSWMAYESNITNSVIRYQTGIGRSNILNSKIIMADIDCANVSDSNLTGVIYVSKNITPLLEEAGMGGITLPWGDLPCGRIERSQIVGGGFIGGDIINSELYNIPAMAFMDFENAKVSNLYLSEGNMTMNITKWAAGVTNFSMPVIDLGQFPLGCDEGTVFAVDGAPYFTFKKANISTLDCWMKFVNSNNVTMDEVNFNNSVGGPTISLYNATITFTNMNYDFNVKLKQTEAYAIIYDLNNAVDGEIILSSDNQYLSNSMISMNSNNYTFLAAGKNVTVVFENVNENLTVYYYPGFATTPSTVVNAGTPCDGSRCRNITYDPVARTLSFETSNFSSYAIGRFTPPSDGGGGEDERMTETHAMICPDGTLRVTVTGTGGEPVSGVRVLLQYYNGDSYFTEGVIYTDAAGISGFALTKDGTYRLSGSKSGYENFENVFDATCCPAEEVPEEQPPAEEGGAEETPPAEEIAPEEEPPGELPPEEQPPAEQPVQPTGDEQPPAGQPALQQECCLLGICAAVLGLCWYWWLLIMLMLIGLAAASIVIFGLKKNGRRRRGQ